MNEISTTGNPKPIGDCVLCGCTCYEGLHHVCSTAPVISNRNPLSPAGPPRATAPFKLSREEIVSNNNAVSPALVLQSLAKCHAQCFVRAKGRMPATPEEFVLWLGEYDSSLWRLLEDMEKTINEYVSMMPPPSIVIERR